MFFPESGLVALSVTMSDGRTAGVTIVGSEGIVGIAAALGETGVMDAAVLVPGIAQSMSAERFRAAMRSSETLRRCVDRYAIALLGHLGQTVACNRLHSLDQRAARWLLLARDRMNSSSFPLTQESFADLLGVSRPAVSTVGARFAARGRRGVPARHGPRPRPGVLEKASCECLASDRELLVPTPPRRWRAAARLPRNLPRTALGMIRPEIRRAR